MPAAQFELPPLLMELIAADRWRHPGDDAISKVLPFLREPVDFLNPRSGVEFFAHLVEDPADVQTFHLCRSGDVGDLDLPWLNADLAVVLAVNRFPGDDVAIALDYRTGAFAPRVVASDWSDGRSCRWHAVAPDFETFAARLGLSR